MPRSLAFHTAPVVVLVASFTLGCRDEGSGEVHVAGLVADPAAAVCGDVVPDHAPDAIGEFEHGYSIPARGNGLRQSPIDIRTRELADGEHDVTLHYEASGEHVRNMGHTVQVQWDAGSWVTFDGVRYEFVQLHFHTPSEHKVDGVTYPLEVHLVHVEADTAVEEPRYLVVGILFREGRDHPFLREVLDEAPGGHGEAVDHPE